MAFTAKTALELETPAVVKGNELIVAYDPDWVEDPEDPDSLPSKTYPISTISAREIPWNMEGPVAPASLELWDYAGMSVEPVYSDPNTYTGAGDKLYLTRLKGDLNSTGKYIFVARLWEAGAYFNGALFSTGALDASDGIQAKANGLFFSAGLLAGGAAVLVDADYVLGDPVLMFLDNAVGSLSIYTKTASLLDISVTPGLTTVGAIHYDAMSGATAGGEIHLSSNLAQLAGELAIPAGYETYEPYGSVGPAVIPQGAKIGDILICNGVGEYQGKVFSDGEYTLYAGGNTQKVIKLEPESAKPIDTMIECLIPTDFTTIAKCFEFYSTKTFSSNGGVYCLLEDGFIIDAQLSNEYGKSTNDWSWFHIQPQNPDTVISVSKSGWAFGMMGCPGTILGRYKYTGELGLPSYTMVRLLVAVVTDNGVAPRPGPAVAAIKRSCGWLQAESWEKGAFYLDYSGTVNDSIVKPSIVEIADEADRNYNAVDKSVSTFKNYCVTRIEEYPTRSAPTVLTNRYSIIVGGDLIRDGSDGGGGSFCLIGADPTTVTPIMFDITPGSGSFSLTFSGLVAPSFTIPDSPKSVMHLRAWHDNVPGGDVIESIMAVYTETKTPSALKFKSSYNGGLHNHAYISLPTQMRLGNVGERLPFLFEMDGVCSYTVSGVYPSYAGVPTEAVFSLTRGARLDAFRYDYNQGKPVVAGAKKRTGGTYTPLTSWVMDTADGTMFIQPDHW